MAALKKYLDYEAKVLARRKKEAVFKSMPKEKKVKKPKKPLTLKQKKMIRRVRAKRFLKTLPNPYGIKV